MTRQYINWERQPHFVILTVLIDTVNQIGRRFMKLYEQCDHMAWIVYNLLAMKIRPVAKNCQSSFKILPNIK